MTQRSAVTAPTIVEERALVIYLFGHASTRPVALEPPTMRKSNAVALLAFFATPSLIAASDSQLPLGDGFPALRMAGLPAEKAMLQLFESMDVVDLMRLTGHGEGLDDKRLVHVFGEAAPRMMTEGDKLRLKPRILCKAYVVSVRL